MMWSQPWARASSALASLPTVPITVRPRSLAHWETIRPTPEDAEIDLLRDPYYMWIYDAYAKTRTDASVAWSKDRWTTTLYANRIGETPNYLAYAGGSYDYVHSSGARAGKWDAYTTYNASVNYNVTPDIQVSFLVNNLFNRYPDMDSSYPGNTGSPYNTYNYNALGRAYYLEARWNFGKSAK